MNIIAYCLMLLLAGWGLRGAYGGAWRGVRDPHRLQDPEHFWQRRGWVEYAFTIEQLTVARQRARRMTTPWQRWRPLAAYLVAFALLALAALLSGCSTVDRQTNVKFWAPSTWPIFSGESKIAAAATAERKLDAAAGREDTVKRTAVHLAHVEFSKLVIALETAAASREIELARRFGYNGLALLDQVDPLTAEESAELRALVRDLLSSSAAARQVAEQRQAAAEAKLGETSRALQAAQAATVAAQATARQANVTARAAGLENLELANELRAWKWRIFWVALACLLLLALSVYLRMGLGSIGAVMPRLPSLIGAENAAKVVGALDAETDRFHQFLASTARRKLEKARTKLAAMAGDVPVTP